MLHVIIVSTYVLCHATYQQIYMDQTIYRYRELKAIIAVNNQRSRFIVPHSDAWFVQCHII